MRATWLSICSSALPAGIAENKPQNSQARIRQVKPHPPPSPQAATVRGAVSVTQHDINAIQPARPCTPGRRNVTLSPRRYPHVDRRQIAPDSRAKRPTTWLLPCRARAKPSAYLESPPRFRRHVGTASSVRPTTTGHRGPSRWPGNDSVKLRSVDLRGCKPYVAAKTVSSASISGACIRRLRNGYGAVGFVMR